MDNILIGSPFLSVRLNANEVLASLNNEPFEKYSFEYENEFLVSIGWLSCSL